MGQAIGIMGGTFDPVHFGHLLAAEQARERFELERIVFVPNGSPPHKKDYQVTPAHARYEMVVLATAANPAFSVSRVEVDRPGPSYSADTVERLRGELERGVRIYFITGADAMLEIATWHQPERLASTCEFIAVMRPGYEMNRLEAGLMPGIRERTSLLAVPGLDISSTELRRRAGAGESLRYLTPPAVERYIEARRLYRADGGGGSKE